MVFASCKEKNASIFFEGCSCEQINLDNGITHIDTFNHFSARFPDTSWFITKELIEGNGLTGCNDSKGYFRCFAITEMEKADPWPSDEEQQQEIEEQFNVLETGSIMYKDEKCTWNLVAFDNDPTPVYSMYITVEHPSDNRFYTLNLSTEQDKNMENRICELESFLKHFEIE